MPSKQTNNDILTQLQIDTATTKDKVESLSGKVDGLDKKIDAGFENLKGYIPAEIYKLHMEAQKKFNDTTDERIKKIEETLETNIGGIKFSNDIVRNVLKTLALAVAAAIIILAALALAKKGGSL